MFSRALRAAPLPLLVVLLASCSSLHRGKQGGSAVDRAHSAWTQLADQGAQPHLLHAYRQSVAHTLKEMVEVSAPDEWPAAIRLNSGWTVKIDQAVKTRMVWKPQLFDELEKPKSRHPDLIKGATRAGLGLPLDGIRKDEEADRESEFVYEGTQHLPVTAVLEFGADAATRREALLRLYDPREVQKVPVQRRKVDLAADFAAPVHEVLARRSFIKRTLGGFFRPERFLNEKSLYIQEPYRADKVPVVFVHGLASDPHIWENAVVAIMSDPDLGSRVQCWCFIYPTALPIPASAARLRRSLQQAEDTFDPDRNDSGLHNMVLVGHSMGGLLSRMQVIDSGDAFWRTWFAVPPEKVPLDGEASRVLRESLLFKANPHVKRVVFIATPHRGSKIADGWIGRLAVSLIKAPLQMVQIMTSIATLDVALLNPDRVELTRMGTTSISGLSTAHPVVEALASRPIKAPYHSIIAYDRDRAKLEETTDGVVPYTSSHLSGAKSEVTVKSRHSCTENPATVKAVTDIVRLHLGLKKK